MKRSAVVIAVAIVAGLIPAAAAAGAPSTAAPAGDRHDRALAQAQAMIADTPGLPGGKSVDTAPDHHLVRPAESPDPKLTGLVTIGMWSEVNETWNQAAHALQRVRPDDLVEQGGGTSGRRKHKPPVLFYEDFAPATLPDGIYYEKLLVELSPLAKKNIGIAVFAEAIATKPRPDDEIVPNTGTSVTVADYPHGIGHPGVTRSLHGAQQTKMIADFNALMVHPGGTSECGGSDEVWTVTFVSDGHTWVATPGSCPDFAVTLDGGQEPKLDRSLDFNGDLLQAVSSNHS